MSIVRLVVIRLNSMAIRTAERIWKTEITPLMISHGCTSEKLLLRRKSEGLISYSEWETEADIDRFTSSVAFQEIVERMRRTLGANAAIEICDLVK
jgi:heme-degrading monooxygenase HmoA